MKTKIMRLLVLVTVLVTWALNGNAANPPASLPFLQSKAALQTYAIEMAKFCGGVVYGESQMDPGNGWSEVVLQTNHTAGDIISFYQDFIAPVVVANPNDPVYFWGSVMDYDGKTLMWCSSAVTPMIKGDGWVLPRAQIVIKLNHTIPVRFTDEIDYAYMEYTDPVTGKTSRYEQMNVSWDHKTLLFQSDAAGKGYLFLRMKDGKQVVYDLRGLGQRTFGHSLTFGVEGVAIENFTWYLDPTTVNYPWIQSMSGVGENISCEVSMTRKAWVNFAFKTTEGAIPIGIWFRPRGNEHWLYVEWGSGMPYVPVELGVGVWYIVPDWDPKQFRQPDPQVDQGKG